MTKLAGQGGFILLFTLFLLSCTMLWGSLVILGLSDQYDASNDVIGEEQSRLLAYSGWNLALAQLETEGNLVPIVQEESAGTLQVALAEDDSGIVSIVAKGVAGDNKNNVNGKVRLQASVWPEVLEWPVVQNLQEIQEPSRILINKKQYQLTENCTQPIAIGAINREPVHVEITKPLSMEALYIDGDLYVYAPLQVVTLCVSGQITGLENIDCEQIVSANEPSLHYRVEVLERNI